VDVLVTNFFCRFGIPRELHSGQGRNFEFRLLQEILQRLGVSKTRTPPPPAPAVGRHGGTLYQNGRGTIAEGRRIQPEGLGRYATIYCTGLSGIHARYHRLHPSKLVIRKRAPTAQRSTVRDTPPTRSGQQSSMCRPYSQLCPPTSAAGQQQDEDSVR
jgi:hypothetical protein